MVKNTPSGAEIAIGDKTLASRAKAYETEGIDSSGNYTLYTLTKDNKACFILFNHIPNYQNETAQIANSFIWN